VIPSSRFPEPSLGLSLFLSPCDFALCLTFYPFPRNPCTGGPLEPTFFFPVFLLFCFCFLFPPLIVGVVVLFPPLQPPSYGIYAFCPLQYDPGLPFPPSLLLNLSSSSFTLLSWLSISWSPFPSISSGYVSSSRSHPRPTPSNPNS